MSNTDTDPALDYLQRNYPFADTFRSGTGANPLSALFGQASAPPDASPKVADKLSKPLPQKQDLSTDLSLPPPPQLRQYDAPLPQKDQFSTPFEVFKDPMIVLAGLSSLFTRRPLTAAMNYAAGAMTGFHQGQKDVFQQNKEKFDEALRATMEQNKVELTRYNAAWDRRKEFNWQKVAPELYTQASANNDQLMMTAIKSGNWELVEKIIEGRERAQERLQEAQVLAGMGLKGGPQALALQRYLQEHPDATAEQIQAFLQAGRSGRSAIGMFVNKFIQEHPEATSDDIKSAVQRYTTQTTAINRFMSGTQGNTIRSLNVVVGHLQTLQELTDALQNGDVTRFNQIAQAWSMEFGKSAPTNFETASRIVGTEIIKALGVGGAGTKEERAEAADGFNRARAPEAIEGSIGVVRKLLLSQLRGLKQQFTASAGYGESAEAKAAIGPAFDDMLLPETREYFGKIDVSKPESGRQPTQKDIDYVKSHPEVRQKFIQTFGREP